ncbi:FAD-dependent oxidoreductase [Myceligenerans halotolerans]
MSSRASAPTPYAQPRIVVVGLGVVGAALADELVLRGMRSVTVLEQGPLYETGGSSSHAPGFVFQTTPSRVMSTLARRTLDKFDGLELDGAWLSKRVGGLEIARTPERLRDMMRRQGLASSWGIPSEVVSPEECARLWPGLDPATVLGGFHTPTDAVVKGVRAVEWQARRATAGGATIIGGTRVTGIRTKNGRVTGVEVLPVPAPDGTTADGTTADVVPADVVIFAAGLWGPALARDLLGFELPMMPMEHGSGRSTPVPSLTALDDDVEVARPMLRHQDFAMYLREWGSTISVGAYEHRPIPVEPDRIAGADEFARTGVHPAMHPLTREDFEPTWQEAQTILPGLRESRLDLANSFNGIFSFTPDGGPMLGPVPGTEGLWLAQAVWVTQSAGVGQVMADWITSGDPGIDTHGLDFRRFDPQVVSHDFTVERAEEAYDEVYDVVHPKAPTLRLRGLRTPPFHDRQQALGAVFGEANGWERPLWYEANATLLEGMPDGAADGTSDGAADGTDPVAGRDAWAARHWSPIAAAEARATRAAVAMYDMTALPRITVSGPRTTAFLRSLLSTDVDKSVGLMSYALLLDEQGGVLSDVTVARLGPEEYHLGINGPLDVAWLREHLPADSAVQIHDAGSGACGIGLWGPNARDVLAGLTTEDVSNEGFRYYRARRMRIAGVPVLALRLSYVGELGWELYAPAEFGRRLWDAIWTAGQPHGLVAAGRRAFESLRLEKGYRLWGTDMTREDSPAEAGVGFAVRPAARQFTGRSALAGRPVTRLLTCLTLDDPRRVVLGSEPVYLDDRVVGYVTSAEQGYTTDTSIAYAWLPQELAEPGTPVEVEYFGERLPATVTAEPIFDPEGKRIR